MGKISLGVLVIIGIGVLLLLRNRQAFAQTSPPIPVEVGKLNIVNPFLDKFREMVRTNVRPGREGSSILRTFNLDGKRFFETEQGIFEDRSLRPSRVF